MTQRPSCLKGCLFFQPFHLLWQKCNLPFPNLCLLESPSLSLCSHRHIIPVHLWSPSSIPLPLPRKIVWGGFWDSWGPDTCLCWMWGVWTHWSDDPGESTSIKSFSSSSAELKLFLPLWYNMRGRGGGTSHVASPHARWLFCHHAISAGVPFP